MRRPLMFGCILTVALIAVLHFAWLPDGSGGPPDGETVAVTGRIYRKNDTSFYLQIQKNATDLWQDNPTKKYLIQKKAPDRLIVEFDGASALVLGSDVTVRGTFRAFDEATNPGEFDYKAYYSSLGFLGRVKKAQVTEQGRTSPGLREGLYRLRCFWERRLYRVFPQKEASVMAAILLGNKEDVDRDVKTLYQKNGMVHILSISGLHITLIGMGIYRLLRRLGLPACAAAVCGCLILVAYGILTGMSISVCRAIGMYLLRMLAVLLGRTYDLLTALGLTAAVLVIQNPAYLEQMGFWLSFGSVLGIGALLPALAPLPKECLERPKRYVEGRWRQALAKFGKAAWTGLSQGALAGSCVTLSTLPIQLWFSYEVPVYSVLLNVLVLPLMSIVMVAGLIAMMIPGLGIVGTVDSLILAGYEKLCGLFERLPFHTWNPGRPQIWQMIVYYLLLLAVIGGTSVCRQRKKEKSLILKIITLTIAVIMLGIHPARGDRVTFLNVGQGDCAVVQSATGEVYLFDCGSSSRSRVGERVLIPFLKYQGIHDIDAVFLSHADADHINGVLELLELQEKERVKIRQIVLPRMQEERMRGEFAELLRALDGEEAGSRRIPVTMMGAGDAWETEQNGSARIWRGRCGEPDRFLCLHPDVCSAADNRGSNALSQCFYIQLREKGECLSILLTGDVEGAGEQELLKELCQREIAGVTVLKVAHHGSRGTTSAELLEQVAPAVSVISCGKNNRYGHPHAELLERLETAGTNVYRTDRCGAVSVELRRGKMVMTQFCR